MPLMSIAVFLALNSGPIPRTEVSKNGRHFSSWLQPLLDNEGDPLVVAMHSNF